MTPPLTFFLLAAFAADVLATALDAPLLPATLPEVDATVEVFGVFAESSVVRAARKERRETMPDVSAELVVELGVFGSFKGSSEPGVPNWAKV